MNSAIPFYQEINEFLESIPSDFRSPNPDFFCLRITPNDRATSNYKPPFKKGFYFMGLVTSAGNTRIQYDNTDATRLDSFLVFQSPGHIYSFHRDPSARGYLIYFKRNCFSFFRPDFESEFPFFSLLQTNFFKLNASRYDEFAPHFEDVFTAYESAKGGNYQIAVSKLLTLLYEMREFTRAFHQWETGFTTPQHLLFQKFMQLLGNFYLEKRTVEEYAEMLHVTPRHLSQAVKLVSGKNPLTCINEKILDEARTLIRFTGKDIAEIAWMLQFSDPANFGKFFRKYCGMTPMEYRKSAGTDSPTPL